MNRKVWYLLAAGLIASAPAIAQGKAAIKTNLLYGGITFTPNISLEIGLGERTTIDIAGGYNPWGLDGNDCNNKKLAHWIVQPEFRYWLCERFNGHFFGVHAHYGRYNISEHNITPLFGKNSQDFRFEGDLIGGGISYGYNWMLSRGFNVEFTVGVGYAYLNYDRYDHERCGVLVDKSNRHYFGPTRAGVTLVFLINGRR